MIIASLALATLGVVMVLLAAAGLLRLPDVYTRSHAAGKAATLGVCSILLGSALGLQEWGGWVRALLSVIFLFVTIPVGTQLLAGVAYRNGAPPAPETRIDPGLHRGKIDESAGRRGGGG